MTRAIRFAFLAAILAALLAGGWLARRAASPDRRDLDALVTVGGDLVRDAAAPAFDLTRLSAAEEVRLGAEVDTAFRASRSIGGPPGTEIYLKSIAATLARGTERQDIPYTVAVIRTSEVNAHAIPGGRIYVTEGMLAALRSEAELAAVLGHEISHVDLRHCVERLQLEVAARRISPTAADLARLGYEVMLAGFSEEDELAADANGALLAARASYDPWAALDVFDRITRVASGPPRTPTRDPLLEGLVLIPGALDRYLATHPPAEQRIEAVRRTLAARADLWRGRRLYAGRWNLEQRRPAQQAPRHDEWVVRQDAPR